MDDINSDMFAPPVNPAVPELDLKERVQRDWDEQVNESDAYAERVQATYDATGHDMSSTAPVVTTATATLPPPKPSFMDQPAMVAIALLVVFVLAVNWGKM